MSYLKFILLISVTFIFASCKSAHYRELMEPAIKAKLTDKNSQQMFDGEIEPPIPDPDENNDTLLGIDANRNGIRDDIDIWINRNAINSNDRLANRQLARALSYQLQSLNAGQNVEHSVDVLQKAIICHNVLSVSLRKKESLNVRLDKTKNPFLVIDWLICSSTKQRQDASNKIRLVEHVAKSGNDDEFGSDCDFEIENKAEAINLFKNN